MKRIHFSILFFAVGFLNGQAHINFDTVALESKIKIHYAEEINYDRQNNIWISTARGLYKIDGYKANFYVHNPNDSLSLKNNYAHGVHTDLEGRLWILLDKGLQRYVPEKDIFINPLYIPSPPEIEAYQNCFKSAYNLSKNQILFGTKAGLFLFDITNEIFTQIPFPDATNIDGYSTSHYVLQIKEDASQPDRLILLTRSGVYTYFKKTGMISLLSNTTLIPFNQIISPIFGTAQYNDQLFISTQKALAVINTSTGKAQSISLPSYIDKSELYIRDIMIFEDELMLSTAHQGFYAMDVKDHSIRPLMRQGHFNKLKIDLNGHLWTVGGTSYILRSTQPIGLNSATPFHHISACLLNGKSIEKREIYTDSILHLRNFQRDLQLQVARINPTDPTQVTYWYKLHPKNKEWLPVNNRTIQINQLSYGRYEVHVKSTSDGDTLEDCLLIFTVERYMYEEWWFRIFVLTTLLLLFGLIGTIIRNHQIERKADQRKLLEMELTALRSQMNPHFLFNTLNSIKNYVLTKSPDEAAQYLTLFSQLIRKILENSKAPLLSLEEELKSISLYIELEHIRFDQNFNYSIDIDPDINTSLIKIPPMLLQPFVENAIWHGLMNKKSDRKLKIAINKDKDGIKCTIVDNGIGREQSRKMYSHRLSSKKSLGLKITEDRLTNLDQLYNIKSHISITDNNPTGTIVTIHLPKIA